MRWERLLKIGIFIYLLTWFIGGFLVMALVRSGVWDKGFLGVDVSHVKQYMYCAFAGSIGGVLYALRIFHEYYQVFNRRWAYWYVMRPFLCGGTAVMIILLFKSGILLMQVPDSIAAQIGISYLVGYGFGKVVDKLKALTETLFNGKKSQDNSKNVNDPIDRTEKYD
ncbi:hypothetical protein [Tumebacillus flagellatus]|uniref:Uncharacterized protein n=1 Tax=Tumebacillus flagellatus TaxID=1157490 RepID=A0A074LVA4_9BACL|nr:hypothetical protein [Tumebacillus flagellatus]KEO83913.1 hypothetical protein EL26_06920 [Tumebacillus flagellatus]